jgi:hypothetical protein
MPGRLRKIILFVAALIVTIEGAPHAESRAALTPNNGPKAIYFLTNNEQNAVVALPVGCDGTLSHGSVTLTGGKGSNTINMDTKMPASPDALSSQSALTISGQV